jgi:transposase
MNEPVCQGCRDRDAIIAALLERIAALETRVQDLEARLNQNSANSSTPPSADPLDAPPRPAKQPSGKKRGAQPGHQAFVRPRLPADRVGTVVPFIPSHCQHCQAALPADAQPGDPEPSWHQVIDLPPVVASVTEYQGHSRTCPCCQRLSHAAIPADKKTHSIGPRLAAFCTYLRSLKVSLRGVQEIAAGLLGVPSALGTLTHLEQEMSAALAAPHAEVVAALQKAPVKHADETSWKQQGKRRWLWVVATLTYAAFVIHDKRGLAGLKAVLGEKFEGVLVSDRWSAYGGWSELQRQVCWAHLKRDFQKCVDYGGGAQAIGAGGLNVVKDLFEAWHLFRGGGCTREDLQERIVPLSKRLKRLLERGQQCALAKVGTFCANLLALWPALWAFTLREGVEPTNNHAERLLRRGVLWRKCSFGSQSAAGSEFVARLLTAVQTLRLQQRSVLPWLVEALSAHRNGLPAPSLLPTG